MNVKRTLVFAVMLLSLPLRGEAQADLESPADTLSHLTEIEVVANLKQASQLESLPLSYTDMPLRAIESEGITAIKDFSAFAPNFYQPDYGSRTTSSIYIRGLGSRMDHPVVGLNVDGIPVMNKSAFDFDFFDIRRIELLRGPQGTLYGRNTSGGVINITTLSPFVWQGLKAAVEYDSKEDYSARVSYYGLSKRGGESGRRFGYSFAASFRHQRGEHFNQTSGEYVDWGNDVGLRNRLQWKRGRGWNLENNIFFSYTRQGGYPYRHLDKSTGLLEPLAYNDTCGYRRVFLSEGFKAVKRGEAVEFSLVTGVNYLDDKMRLDQDFTNRDYFTLLQKQREVMLSQEFVIKNRADQKRWQWLVGAFLFWKEQKISAPVNFHKEGIDDLILSGVNSILSKVMPRAKLVFAEESFPIESDFKIPTMGAALFHESNWLLGRWRITAGIRLDYEKASMDYDSHSLVHYRLTPMMPQPKELITTFTGSENVDFVRVLPKFALSYLVKEGDIYATVTRGYRAGGFNTNIFSDMLQNNMMHNMMKDMRLPQSILDKVPAFTNAENATFKPEENWNFELGAHLNPLPGMRLDLSAFYILCRNQQVTVLPTGMATGRMMSNAARSHSLGGEISLSYRRGGLNLAAGYGITRAEFDRYEDGDANYKGNRLPYAPASTLSAMASYRWDISGSKLLKAVDAGLNLSGIGKIYWDNENLESQSFYSLLGAHITADFGKLRVTAWGKNILDRKYNTFYFVSLSEKFFCPGAGARFGIKLDFEL